MVSRKHHSGQRQSAVIVDVSGRVNRLEFCVTPGAKNGRLLVTQDDRNNIQASRRLRLAQHRRPQRIPAKMPFWLRKPLFYPLNYGNNDSFDFRFSIADCK